MGSNMNFKNFGNEIMGDGNGSGNGNGRSFGVNPLTRQSSVYSLTFDEFQSTLGGVGKDFGSMNMDELLKNIWSAEETQSMTTAAVVGSSGPEGGSGTQGGGYLQRQGSLTLPRTLSQKTVDEVWKDIAKEFNGGKDGTTGSSVPQTQRQQTLGEMTLEEFLVRAGVVREDMPMNGKSNVGGIFGADNTGFGINFQQPGRGVELMADSDHRISMQSTNLPLRTSQQQPTQSQIPHQVHAQQHQQQQQQQQTRLFPKQVAASYASTMTLPVNGQLASPRIRGGNLGLSDQGINNNLVPALQGGGMGMFEMGGRTAIGVPNGSPATLSSDGLAKSNGDTSSVSPIPYVFNGGLRGRKCGNVVEKVVERRQRRMIKNRESAARSRARKQAYTMELEQEVAKLKEENQELCKKQQEILEMQKNQVLEMMNVQSGPRKRLRRTQTGPW